MNELLPSPHITALNDKEQIQQMRSYLFQLKESLEFILTNIGTENLSDTLLKDLKNMGMSIAEVQSDVDMRQKTTVGLINESNLTVSDVINSALFEAEIQEVKDYADSVAGTVGEHDHTVSDITDFPSTMPPSAHTHTKSEISDFPTSMTPTAHTHTKSEVTDFSHTHTEYLDKTSGGTVSAASAMPVASRNTVSDACYYQFAGKSGNLGALGFNGANNPVWVDSTSSSAKTLLHTGNLTLPASTAYTTAQMRNAVIVSTDPGEGVSVSYPNGTLIFVKG